jgi:hypothetical protein
VREAVRTSAVGPFMDGCVGTAARVRYTTESLNGLVDGADAIHSGPQRHPRRGAAPRPARHRASLQHRELMNGRRKPTCYHRRGPMAAFR